MGRGSKQIHEIGNGSKEQVTVVACFNANGNYINPTILMSGQRLRDIGMSAFPEAHYGMTSNGWMYSEMFVEFFTISEVKAVLLVVDGHTCTTHISLLASKYAKENGIIL